MPRILVIDSDPDLIIHFENLRTKFAEAFPFELTFAASDEEALAIIHGGADFEVAMVAVDCPDVSGLNLFQKIENRAFRVPRLALTSTGELQTIRTAMNEGAKDFLIKPFTGQDFFITIDRIIEEVERRRHNWRAQAEFSALKREVDIAGDIQRRILPETFPTQAGFEFHAAMTPAKTIGGDFYDAFEIELGRTGFVVADVSGKGIPAAFYMAVARTLLRTVALTGAGPADCLKLVNDLLFDHQIPGMFVSCFYGVADHDSGRVVYCNGGHHPPVLWSDTKKEWRFLEESGGVVLGVQDEHPYDESEVVMSSGDVMFLYTDGVTEAFNTQREAFGEDRLAQSLRQCDGKNARAVIEHVADDIATFVDGANQSDDLTSMVLKRLV